MESAGPILAAVPDKPGQDRQHNRHHGGDAEKINHIHGRSLGKQVVAEGQAVDIADQLAPLVHALNGDGYQAVMAKASLRIKGYLSSTAMRLPNIGPDADQLAKAEEGMKAAGLL